MSLTSAEVTDLLRRAQLSVTRGYTIARGEFYAHELGGSDSSPVGLLALCRAALVNDAPGAEDAPALTEGSEDEPKALPEVASAGEPEPASPEPPVDAEPESAPEPELEPEPAPAAEETVEEDSSDDDTSETYESWSKKKLLAAATERGLEVNNHNIKAEIIAALRAAD